MLPVSLDCTFLISLLSLSVVPDEGCYGDASYALSLISMVLLLLFLRLYYFNEILKQCGIFYISYY
jgi:hypothetical protein